MRRIALDFRTGEERDESLALLGTKREIEQVVVRHEPRTLLDITYCRIHSRYPEWLSVFPESVNKSITNRVLRDQGCWIKKSLEQKDLFIKSCELRKEIGMIDRLNLPLNFELYVRERGEEILRHFDKIIQSQKPDSLTAHIIRAGQSKVWSTQSLLKQWDTVWQTRKSSDYKYFILGYR